MLVQLAKTCILGAMQIISMQSKSYETKAMKPKIRKPNSAGKSGIENVEIRNGKEQDAAGI